MNSLSKLDAWIWDYLEGQTVLVKIALMGMTSVLLTLLGYAVLVQKNMQQYHALQQEVAHITRVFERKQHQASILPAYREQVDTLQTQYDAMLQSWSLFQDVTKLLDDISNMGMACGIRFELIEPLSETLHDFYVALPIKWVAVGQYQQLARFASQLANSNWRITFQDFMLVNADLQAKSTVVDSVLKWTMTIIMYRHRSI